MNRVEKLRKAEQARRAEQQTVTPPLEQAKVTVPAKPEPVVLRNATVTITDQPPAPKPPKPRKPKKTPEERDAAMKGRRFPVQTSFNACMTGPEEWVVSVCTPDGFAAEQIGPGIHALLSKADDMYREWLRMKEAPTEGQS